MGLIWDFYRQVSSSDDAIGACVHYFDETAQSFTLDAGRIKTRTCKIPAGHWSESVFSSDLDIGAFGYTRLAISHPHNGSLYGVATDGTNLYFLRYFYAMDISDIYDTGSWQEQVDNQTKSLSLNIKNIAAEIFAAENTLFNPGAKITIRFTAGNSEPYSVGVAYLDDIEYDAYSSSVPVAARNPIGYFLSEQTFDDRNLYSGGRSTVFSAILWDAGITSYHVRPDDTPISLQFDSNTTILEGTNKALQDIGWRMIDLPTGEIVIGDEAYIATFVTNGRYIFNGGNEVFKRRTTKNADAAFTRICVKSSNGVTVYRSVPYWNHWQLGARKTKHFDLSEEYTQSDIEAKADSLVSELQYVGIGESFSGPIRPQLLVGDIAEIYYPGDAESISLGIITQVAHQFGQSGFSTNFTLDSGGTSIEAEGYSVVSKVAILNGYNRRQRVLDFMYLVTEKKAVSTYSGGGLVSVQSSMVESATISPASIIKIW